MSISERNDKSNDAASVRRLEIFTGAGRRRAWTAEQKAAIVAESVEDGARVSQVARRHGLSPQQLCLPGAGRLAVGPRWTSPRRPSRRSSSGRRARRSRPASVRIKRATCDHIQSNWTSTDRASGCGPAPRSRW